MSFENSHKKPSFLSQAANVMQSIKTGTAMAMLSALFLTACAVIPFGEDDTTVTYEAAIVSTLAGGKESGFVDGQGENARFRSPKGIAIDAAGNLYVADSGNHRIRKVTPEGEVSTLAGSGETGYNKGGFADGEGQNAKFNEPSGIVIDAAGNLYVADKFNHSIRRITPEGKVSTLAGNGEKGIADGEGSDARFNDLGSIAIDAAGNLYVADGSWDNRRIRKITPDGVVSSLVGDYGYPSGIAIDAAGNLYWVRGYGIYKMTPNGEISLFAGGKSSSIVRGLTVKRKWTCRGRSYYTSGATCDWELPDAPTHVDGKGSSARFYRPSDIAMDTAGNLYVVDGEGSSIRKVTKEGEVSTLNLEKCCADDKGNAAWFRSLEGIAADAAGNLYVTEGDNNIHRIHKIVIQRR